MNDWPTSPPTTQNDFSSDSPHVTKLCDGSKKEGVFSEDKNLPANIPQRDEQGRFLTGNKGGGRKKGSRNKLTEMFIKTIVEDFAEHGADTLERLRESDPAFYLKMIAVLVPKALIEEYETKHDYTNITDEELIELANNIKRQRNIEQIIESASK